MRQRVRDVLKSVFDPAPFAGVDVAVAVPDLTRPIDYAEALPPLFDALASAGPTSLSVTVALGLHRPLEKEELEPLVEVAADRDVDVRQHEPEGELMTLADDVADGRSSWPTLPAIYPEHLAEADRIVTVGTVEPHQYAGFSGGAKGVAIGCAAAETIGAMHGVEFLRQSGTQVGRLEGNPFQQALWELSGHLPDIHGLQIVPPSGGRAARAAWGPVDESFEEATNRARERFFRTREEPVDWMHLSVPPEKGSNFYQASRAATYVALVDRPAVRDGGTLVVEAPCPEGIGRGAGERACAEAMARGRDALLAELESSDDVETTGGQQRAYVVAKALDRFDIALVGAPEMEPLDAMGIEQFSSVEEARDALDLGPDGESVEEVFHAVPILAD